MQKTTLYVPSETQRRLRDLARRTERPQAELIREAIERYLAAAMPSALDPFLADLQSGAFSLECGERDMARIRELATRYDDLPLGFADASVIACAERNGGAVLSFDVRDFGVVAREGTIRLATA